MSLSDVFLTGQQTWPAYINNRELIRGFDRALARSEDRTVRVLLRTEAAIVAQQAGLGAVADNLESALGDLHSALEIGFDTLATGIGGLRADFNVLLGDVIWKLELQNTKLQSILEVLQAPLDTTAKELRKRAEDAYRFGWYEEALRDLLESEKQNYQDFIVHRSLGHIYLYHLIDLPKAVDYFRKSAKYARPRDTRLCAEANYFAAMACAAQHDLDAALIHLKEAISLNDDFAEAHFMSSCVAAMLGETDAAIRSLVIAIRQDLRYFERARAERMLEPARDRVNELLAGLRQKEINAARCSIDQLRRATHDARRIPGCVLEDADRAIVLLQSRADTGMMLNMRSVTAEAAPLGTARDGACKCTGTH